VPVVLVAALLATLVACGTAPAGTSLGDPVPSATLAPASPGASSSAPTAGPAQLPAAVLVLAGTEAPGTLGSWTLDGQGSDSPWLPAAALAEVEVGPGPLMVRPVDGASIGAWSAHRAPASDPSGRALTGLGGREEDTPALDAVALDPLPAGRWVVAVRLNRADGRGDATFYWLLAAT
jgi:hypothetical protein